ncbi:hypothetical protein TARUN_2334 [Trichoderma arundinaceum]|uniref:Uncharacterized protein n=1 Tax=Trichoderma arundinaceum TaxID=490622 RepID=A0A395NUX1_TRIAR|nr:hypothetical protein TARUN_2334 [Trichoderma arundinaceum]
MPLSNKKNNNVLAAEQQNLAASGVPGSTYGHGAGYANAATANLPGPAPFTAGPHRHDFMNKLDPTVDSGTGGMQVLTSGPHGNATAGGVPGQTTAAGQVFAQGGVMGSNNPYNGPQHNSRLANALDPRVDSTTQPGAGNYYTMGTNVIPAGAGSAPRNVPEGTYGPHNSRMANAADPRIDSDADRRTAGRTGAGAGHMGAGAGAGTSLNSRPIYPPGVGGPAPTTAGPHRHDILNKLDPTVNSQSATGVDGAGRRVL